MTQTNEIVPFLILYDQSDTFGLHSEQAVTTFESVISCTTVTGCVKHEQRKTKFKHYNLLISFTRVQYHLVPKD